MNLKKLVVVFSILSVVCGVIAAVGLAVGESEPREIAPLVSLDVPRFEHNPDWGLAPDDRFWRESQPSAASGSKAARGASGPSLDDVIERTNSRFFVRDGDPRPTSEGASHLAILTERGMRMQPYASGRALRPGAAELEAEVSLDWNLRSISLSAGEATDIGGWFVDENTGQRRIETPAGTVIEHINAGEQGVERSWVLPDRPSELGDLVIDTTLEGLSRGPQTESGHHFVDSEGRARVRVGPAILVDASGQRTAIESQTTEDGLRYVVPKTLLASADYPLALDPIIGPEFGIDEPIYDHTYRSHRLWSVSGNGDIAVVTWLKRGALQNTLWFARISADGLLLDRSGRVLTTNASDDWVFAVAANKEKALVAWVSRENTLESVLLDVATGVVLASKQLDIAVSLNKIAIGTNGHDFLVAYDKLKFLRVDGNTGSVFAGDVPRPRDYSSPSTRFPSIVFAGGHYMATFVTMTDHPTEYLVSVRIDDHGPGTFLELQQSPTVVYRDDGHVQLPALCASPDGLLSVYRWEGPDARELRGQRLAVNGDPVGPSFLMHDIDMRTGHYPNTRCSGVPGRNEFAVTLGEFMGIGPGSRSNVVVQRYSVDATLLDERVIGDPALWSDYSHVTRLGEGSLLVYGSSQTFPPRHIRYVRLDANSEPVGDAKILTGPPTAQASLALAGERSKLLAAWTDDRLGAPEVFSIEYDVAGSPPEATLVQESRLAHGSARAFPVAAMTQGGSLVASLAVGKIEISRIEEGSIAHTESVGAALNPIEPLALASRETSDSEAVAAVLAFLDATQSSIHAIALTSDGRAIGDPIEVANGCAGCLLRPSVALNDDQVMIVYLAEQSPAEMKPILHAWSAELNAAGGMPSLVSPVTGDVSSEPQYNGASVVSNGPDFVAYYPNDDGTEVVIDAVAIARVSGQLETEDVKLPRMPCDFSPGICSLTASTTGVWDFIGYSASDGAHDAMIGFARKKSNGETAGPFNLSTVGSIDVMPAVASLGGSKFAVGYIEALDATEVLSQRATVRLIDLEEDGDGDGYTPADGDCDDSDPDNKLPQVYFADEDGDGYGNPEFASEPTCIQPPGHVSSELPTDCDDSDALFGVFEVVADADGDGFGDQGALPEFGCIGDGFTLDRSDCNDEDPVINPNAVELASNDIDENCDGQFACLDDQDGDGKVGVFTHGDPCGTDYPATEIEDCDDSNAAVYSGANEIVGSGVDEDCDGQELCYADADGDGFGTSAIVASLDTDCDDFGESDLDQDCDDTPGVGGDIQGPSLWYPDVDGDGYGDATAASLGSSCTVIAEGVPNDLDCNDNNADVRPGAYELCGDATDQDCDGFADRPGCHADACEGELGNDPHLYQAGVREPDPAYAPDPPPGLTIQGLYLAESEATLAPLENLHFSIDEESGGARLAGRLRVDALNAPGGGGSVGDVWSLNVVMRPATDCEGAPCAPDTDERLNVSEVAHRWRYYTPVVATLSSSELQNPDNKFTYHHILEPAEPGHTVQVGPSASGASLRCGLRFKFIHDSDLRDPAIPDMSGEGELVLDLGAKPGTEAVAVRGGAQ
ncbi:MAG: putative metal-binding motif-containing protein [Myxococcota bacterium]